MTDRQGDELVESWINGNRKWVMDQIAGMPTVHAAAYAAVYVDRRLTEPEARRAFLSMLQSRS